MIAQVLRLTRWELFKVRKRWMPWILLIVTLVVVQATLWGFYAAYGNVGNEYASGYPGVPDARGRAPTVTITCADILDGTAAAKAEKVSEEFREQARKTPLRRERCLSIVEQIAEERHRHRGFFVPSGGSRQQSRSRPLHRRLPRHGPGGVLDGGRVWLGHPAYSAGKGYREVAVPGGKGIVTRAIERCPGYSSFL